jgi:hypothetical protein
MAIFHSSCLGSWNGSNSSSTSAFQRTTLGSIREPGSIRLSPGKRLPDIKWISLKKAHVRYATKTRKLTNSR